MENLLPGLYLVATPLGNMGDISKRAIEVLSSVDVIACEDTREMKKLLNLLGIEKRDREIISIHEHNEFEKSASVCKRIEAGDSVAYASDAGMPGISDPGAILVDSVLDSGLFVTSIPGATAITTAFALSGFDGTAFSFMGFFPRATKEKNECVQILRSTKIVTIFYESPKRLSSTLGFLAQNLEADRRVVVARELTKKHEEIFRGTFAQAAQHFNENVKGECVLVIDGQDSQSDVVLDEAQVQQALKVMKSAGISSRDACDALAPLVDVPKNRLKDLYLEISG